MPVLGGLFANTNTLQKMTVKRLILYLLLSLQMCFFSKIIVGA